MMANGASPDFFKIALATYSIFHADICSRSKIFLYRELLESLILNMFSSINYVIIGRVTLFVDTNLRVITIIRLEIGF